MDTQTDRHTDRQYENITFPHTQTVINTGKGPCNDIHNINRFKWTFKQYLCLQVTVQVLTCVRRSNVKYW